MTLSLFGINVTPRNAVLKPAAYITCSLLLLSLISEVSGSSTNVLNMAESLFNSALNALTNSSTTTARLSAYFG